MFSSAGKLCQQPQLLRQEQGKSRDGSAVCSEWSCGLGSKDTPESTEGSRRLSWQSCSAPLAAHPHPCPHHCELASAGTGTAGTRGMGLHPGEGLQASGRLLAFVILILHLIANRAKRY